MLLADLASSGVEVRVAGAELFKVGDWVLLFDLGGNSESAEVVLATRETLAFRSIDSTDGELLETYSPYRRARVAKLREVRFRLERGLEEEENVLTKEVSGGTPQVLARGVRDLKFDYLDGAVTTLNRLTWISASAWLSFASILRCLRPRLNRRPRPSRRPSRSAVTRWFWAWKHGACLDYDSPISSIRSPSPRTSLARSDRRARYLVS